MTLNITPDFRMISADKGINLALVRKWETDVSWPMGMSREEAEQQGKLWPCIRVTYLTGDREVFFREEGIAVKQQIEASDHTQHIATDHTHCRDCNVAIHLCETLCSGCQQKKLEATSYQQ